METADSLSEKINGFSFLVSPSSIMPTPPLPLMTMILFLIRASDLFIAASCSSVFTAALLAPQLPVAQSAMVLLLSALK